VPVKRLPIGVLFLLLCVPNVAPGQTTDDPLVRGFTDSALEGILRDFGYTEVEVREPSESGTGSLRFMVEGATVTLYNYADGDLQLWWGVVHPGCSLETVNEWNQTKRLSRAYLDEEGDPILEADLLANAGINKEMVQEFISVFALSRGQYRAFIADRCK